MSSKPQAAKAQTVRTLIPARMDRLPWTGFHWLVVISLGVSWILDGLEIQIVSLVSPVLQNRATLHLTTGQTGYIGSSYLFGEVVGALIFGRLTDHFGRRRLFMLTLALYLVATGISGLSPTLWFLLLFRFIAGLGIGGEYAAINSAIDELIPSCYRGRTDIAINGTYWFGAMIGSAAWLFFSNPHFLPINVGWRIAFFIGPVLGVIILFLRRSVPESPRWLMTHGRYEEAEKTVSDIEARVERSGVKLEKVDDSKAIEIRAHGAATYREIASTMLRNYRSRSSLGLSMMITQSFLYNAIFFTYALVLVHFFKIPNDQTSYYIFPFAAGNLLGPLLLGRFFDTVGRRTMILLTYGTSGILLGISGYLFDVGALSAVTETIFWCVVFFFASAGASSAYLTISEIFPLELRAQAISFFFAIAQLIGGVAAPSIFAALVGSGTQHGPLATGYYFAAAIMVGGGLVGWFFGVDAERRSLEDIAQPLSELTTVVGGRRASGTSPA